MKPVARATWLGTLLALTLAAWPTPAGAHGTRLAALHLIEGAPGTWTARRRAAPDARALPAWPVLGAGCTWTSPGAQTTRRFTCKGEASDGLALDGATGRTLDIFVHLAPRVGDPRTRLVRGGRGVVFPPRARAPGPLAYAPLGMGHVLGGLDHLLFLAVLVAAVRRLRPLLLATASFTLGHALTLSLAATVSLGLPGPAVEVLIAGSIVITAAAALRTEGPALTGHGLLLPALLGAVHGLGFAGALAELGLPEGQQLGALLAFNLGVELAQLGVVAGVFGTSRLLARASGRLADLARPLSWAAGLAGAVLLWGRLLVLLGAA